FFSMLSFASLRQLTTGADPALVATSCYLVATLVDWAHQSGAKVATLPRLRGPLLNAYENERAIPRCGPRLQNLSSIRSKPEKLFGIRASPVSAPGSSGKRAACITC